MSKKNIKSLQDPALWENGTITPKLYFEYRLNPLIEWNEKSATRNKHLYTRLTFLQLFLSVLVPMLVGFIGDDTFLKYIGSTDQQQIIIACLGFILTFVTSLFSIFQFKDKWVDRTKTMEDMKRETMEYLSRTASYYRLADADAFNQLVVNVESIISNEYSQLVQMMDNNGDSKTLSAPLTPFVQIPASPAAVADTAPAPAAATATDSAVVPSA